MSSLARRLSAVAIAALCLLPTAARADDPASDLLRSLDPFAGPASRPLLADNVITGPPATRAATQPVDDPATGAQRSLAEFVGHFSPYDPTYFVAGPADPLVKFQFSFKYRIFNPASPLGKVPVIGQLHFAYTQLSLWQLDKPSSPFFDTNYQPELFYSDEDVKWLTIPGVRPLGLQAGFGHDSNGQSGDTSRQVNLLFVRPILNFGDPDGFHFYVALKAYVYVGTVSENPDIARFRGYCDLRAVVGWRYGVELSALARWGSHYDRGAVTVDLTYPLRDLLYKNVDLYLDAQYFTGYGESLVEYNRRTDAFRIGIGLVR